MNGLGGGIRSDVLTLEEILVLSRPQLHLPSLAPHLPPYLLLRVGVSGLALREPLSNELGTYKGTRS